MLIELNELKRALDAIFSHLEERGIRSVGIEGDYYWNIPTEEIYDALKDPLDLDLGQLSDDWERLKSIANGSSPPIGRAFIWSGVLLRKIGESNPA